MNKWMLSKFPWDQIKVYSIHSLLIAILKMNVIQVCWGSTNVYGMTNLLKTKTQNNALNHDRASCVAHELKKTSNPLGVICPFSKKLHVFLADLNLHLFVPNKLGPNLKVNLFGCFQQVPPNKNSCFPTDHRSSYWQVPPLQWYILTIHHLPSWYVGRLSDQFVRPWSPFGDYPITETNSALPSSPWKNIGPN